MFIVLREVIGSCIDFFIYCVVEFCYLVIFGWKEVGEYGFCFEWLRSFLKIRSFIVKKEGTDIEE